jgi:hypothetical protein
MGVTIDYKNLKRERILINPNNGERIEDSRLSKIKSPNVGAIGAKKSPQKSDRQC